MFELKNEFPIYQKYPKLVYLDSAATALKPRAAILAVTKWYSNYCAPIHRSNYDLSEKATTAYENCRKEVANFIGAQDPEEIVFTKNATESINLIANGLKKYLKKGDNLVISESEHHSNIVPWQQIAKELCLEIRYVSVTSKGQIDLKNFQNIVNKRTKIISVSHCSNVLGTVAPLSKIREIAHQNNPKCLVIIDASQTVPHLTLSVEKNFCDLLFFSGHKMYAPSGVGVVWGKISTLQNLEPLNYGGGMIEDVSPTFSSFQSVPAKLEGGTPNAEGVYGLAEAIRFIQLLQTENKQGLEAIEVHISKLHQETLTLLKQFTDNNKIQIIGNPDSRIGILTFICPKYHPHDLAYLLNKKEICLRAGQHCASPLHKKLNLIASNRISFGVNNTIEDVHIFIDTLNTIL